MLGNRRASDGETSEEMLNSSQSSESRESSFERCSFEGLVPSPSTSPIRQKASFISTNRSAVSLKDFHLVRRVGSGDTGTVYLCRLRQGVSLPEASSAYAMKVVNKEALGKKKKTHRLEMEVKVLSMVNHPFLPRLFAHVEDPHYACIITEFCSGGDLHRLRHKLPKQRFSLTSARFYAAEVLVALEYLHMLGIVYRDLKPENVLIRSDGHVMLTDFDLCMCSAPMAAVEYANPSKPTRKATSCFPISLPAHANECRARLIAEPVDARSCSFVGTHEYVAPEVASGEAHGSAVDWWAFGVFLYEMIYGRTPFRGATNDATLRNILAKPLSFPTPTPATDGERHARKLLSALLTKQPDHRLGSICGAAEIKIHPFFKAINFALIRSAKPPITTSTGQGPRPSSPSFAFF